MKIYGIPANVDENTNFLNPDTYTSEEVIAPLNINENMTATTAVIDNTSLAISNISATFKDASNEGISYYFIVKNEGEYSAYIKKEDFDANYNKMNNKECKATSEINKDLVTAACEQINIEVVGWSSDGRTAFNKQSSFGTHEIKPDDYIILTVNLSYSPKTGSVVPDQTFSVEFPDLELEFTSTP